MWFGVGRKVWRLLIGRVEWNTVVDSWRGVESDLGLERVLSEVWFHSKDNNVLFDGLQQLCHRVTLL